MSKQNSMKSQGVPSNKPPKKSNQIKVNTENTKKPEKPASSAPTKAEYGLVKFDPAVSSKGQNPKKPNRKIAKFAESSVEAEIVGEPKKRPVAAKRGVVQRGRKNDIVKAEATDAIDPEIALMANRASAAERVKPGTVKPNTRRRSMSGMVGESVRPRGAEQTTTTQTKVKAVEPTEKTAAEAEGELRFSKAKSMLIGVGVALAVAVIGFVGIGIFSAKPTCVVSFDANGGAAEVAATEFVCGRTVARPTDPVKEGFTFEGWIFEGDEFDFSEGIYKNATLIAKWKANEGTEIVTVKFDTDGGSAMNDVEVKKGATMAMPAVPTKMGYVFVDWYLGDKVYDFTTPVTENITLKAKWEKRQTQNNGTSSSSSSNNNSSSSAKDTKRVTSITAAGNMTVELGQTGQIILNIVPAAAEYKLTVSSSDENVATCSVARTVVTCTAKQVGRATITVRDTESGNRTSFTVSVPAQDTPDVSQPEEDPKEDDKNDPEQPSGPGTSTTPSTPGDDDGDGDDESGGGGEEPDEGDDDEDDDKKDEPDDTDSSVPSEETPEGGE